MVPVRAPPCCPRDQNTVPPRPGARIVRHEISQSIGLKRMRPAKRGLVGQPVDMMQGMQAFMQKNDGKLGVPQSRIKFNATSAQIGLTKDPQSLRALDAQAAHRPGLIPHQQPAGRFASDPQVGAVGPQQGPSQGRIASDPLCQTAGQGMGEMFFGAFVQQYGLRVVHQSNHCMKKGATPGRRAQALSDEDGL